MFDLQEQLKILPDQPGVYLMKNKDNEIIYVGKAISLKNRVRQYFQSSKNHAPKVRAMVANIDRFEYIVTDSELEALILECNLIKENKPKYNILLRDDKTYPYIKITLNEEFPRIIKTRKVIKDKAKYFGPYTNITALNETLDIIHQLYPVRTCSKNIPRMIEKQERPCLNYHIKKCIGPCTGKVTETQYMEMLQEVMLFLSGKEVELIKSIEEKMKVAAKEMDFEKAARYRDQIGALNNIVEKQKIVTTNLVDQDIIAMAKGEGMSCVQVFFIRQGKLVQREHFMLETEEESKGEILSSFVKQFYSNTKFIPKEVLIEEGLEDQSVVEEWLSNIKGSKVALRVPQRGEKKDLMEMVSKNAQITLEQTQQSHKSEKEKTETALNELQDLLQLEAVPHRIESFDISNIQGVESVGSMVVFEGGKPINRDYRRFKIKTVKGPNDYASLEEIVARRYKRGLVEVNEIAEQSMEVGKSKFAYFPDLIMVDGGLGQVSSAQKALSSLGIDIPVCGMIKDDKHRTKGLVYQGRELIIEKTSPVFRLITKIQDEVHRFAITYHRSLRSKSLTHSQLEEIQGVGPTTRKELIKHFGSLEKVQEASLADLLQVKGMNRKTAENIVQYFQES